MKLYIVPITLLLSLVSCQGGRKEQVVTEIKTPNLETNTEQHSGEQKLRAYCFYKLDDKYSVENDSGLIADWLKKKSLEIEKDTIVENILGQNGGGMHGAQKNPYTDLYLAVVTNSNDSNEVPEIRINGQLYTNNGHNFSTAINWYPIKLRYWEDELRAIKADDLKQQFSEDVLLDIKERNLDAFEILGEGEVLKFEIKFKEQKITKYFHAIYYE